MGEFTQREEEALPLLSPLPPPLFLFLLSNFCLLTMIELPCTITHCAKFGQVRALRIEHLHPVIVLVRHIHQPQLLIDGNAPAMLELARTGAGTTKFAHKTVKQRKMEKDKWKINKKM